MTLFGHQLRLDKWQTSKKSSIKQPVNFHSKNGLTLADITPGCQTKIAGFSESLPAERRAYLLSYGLVPGYSVDVIQHSPVTIIRVEHIELALERELARGVQVTEI